MTRAMLRVKVCCIRSIEETRLAVRPFGVDLCTGVRSAGALDEQKLSRFMAGVAAVA